MQKRKRSDSNPGAGKRKYQSNNAMLLKAMERKVAMAAEKKGVDGVITHAPVLATFNTNSGITIPILIAPGTASYNRVGRKVHLKSLRIRGAWELATVSRGNVARMTVVHDKQPSGVLPTFDAIFGQTAQDGTEAVNLWSPIRYDNMDRFSILRDCYYDLNMPSDGAYGGGTLYAPLYVHVDEYIKLSGKEVVYSGQTSPTTIADVSSGAIYIVFRAYVNNGATPTDATTTQVDFNGMFRLRYTD
jgi:hypothetical protein